MLVWCTMKAEVSSGKSPKLTDVLGSPLSSSSASLSLFFSFSTLHHKMSNAQCKSPSTALAAGGPQMLGASEELGKQAVW